MDLGRFLRPRPKVHYLASVVSGTLFFMDPEALRASIKSNPADGNLISRTLRRFTRSAAPQGAAWRALSERQACLAMLGHELIGEHHASHADELVGAAADIPVRIAVGAYEDIGAAMSMTTR